MNLTLQDERSWRYGGLVLLAMVLVLGLRVRGTMATVMRTGFIAGEQPVPAPAERIDDAALMRQRRELDTAVATGRDPFIHRDVRPVPRPDLADAPAEVRRAIGPALSALVHDHRDPTVQITVDGRRSGWLRPGDTFHGWKVTEITPRTVTITKGGKRVILP